MDFRPFYMRFNTTFGSVQRKLFICFSLAYLERFFQNRKILVVLYRNISCL
jgi:hypothetical protein